MGQQFTVNTPVVDNINTPTETENYISKKYDELALSHLKQQILSEIREVIKYETDNAPKKKKKKKKMTPSSEKHNDTLTTRLVKYIFYVKN